MKYLVILSLLSGLFLFGNSYADTNALTIQQINWGKEKTPARMTIVSHDKEKTCYNVIGFYPDVAKSFSVRYNSSAKNKDKKWNAKFGAWECTTK